MANLKEIRNRISSVKSTKQITSAMKTVSASKLNRSQQAIQNLKKYADTLQKVINNITFYSESEDNSEFFKKGDPKSVLIVGISSNRGLCGAFNNNVIKRISKEYQKHKKLNREVKILGIGNKIIAGFKRNKDLFNDDEINTLITKMWHDTSYETTKEISSMLTNAFLENTFDEIIIIYNALKSSARQIVTKETFLPIKTTNQEKTTNTDYIFEPLPNKMLPELLPKYLNTQLLKAILDSIASEHAARMTAMHNATENATELIQVLNLEYNKLRQAAITNEILEIVSGSNALKG